MKRAVSRALLMISVFSIVLVSACNQQTGNGTPEKLYPYEVPYDAAEYRQRRDDLSLLIPEGAIAVLTTNSLYIRNGDDEFEFRPSSTFYYLTGFEEPNAVAVLRKRPDLPFSSEMIMFVQERSGVDLRWLGPVCGPEGAVARFGADAAYAIGTFSEKLKSLLASWNVSSIYTNLGDNEAVQKIISDAAGAGFPVIDVKPLVDEKRLVKSQHEIDMTKRANEVTIQAFIEGIKGTEPLMYEYEVEAAFDFILGLNGCYSTAYETILASGPNSCILHYSKNNRQMQTGELVMIDFGAEYGYYAADITRTFPVNGKFTGPQAVIYDIVKTSHEAIMAAAAPGVNWNTLVSLGIEIMIDGLLYNGVISGSRSELISEPYRRQYIPAGLGHQIGLDVHDPWPVDAQGNKILRANMLMAIEPGIYLEPQDGTVAEPYRGISVRMEDNILITGTGSEIIDTSLPRTREEIENMMR